MNKVTKLSYAETRLSANGKQIHVGRLIEILGKVDPSLLVSCCADGFNFVELDENSVCISNGSEVVLGIFQQIQRNAA